MIHYLVGHIAAMKIIKILLKKVPVIISLSDNVTSLLEIDLPSVLQNKKTKSKLLNMAIKTDWSCPSKIGPCPALQPLLSLFPAIIIYDTATSNFLLFPTHIHTIFQPKVLLTLLPLTGMPSSQLTSDTAIISLTTLCGLLLHPFKMKLNNNCLDPSHLTVKH